MEATMSVNLSIKNASNEVVEALKSRARQNHRSLQGELMAIIEAAAVDWLQASDAPGFGEAVVEWRARDQIPTAQEGREASAYQAARERNIQHLITLMKQGLPLGGRSYSRDEMHER
jgi:Arc-like DNA binding domain